MTVRAGSLSIVNNGTISGGTFGSGNGGNVTVGVAGGLLINGPSMLVPGVSSGDRSGGTGSITGITSQSFGRFGGNAGSITVDAGALTILGNGEISAATFGAGNGGSVSVGVAGGLSIDGTGGDPRLATGISSEAEAGSTGNAGSVTVEAGGLLIVNGGSISSSALQPSGNLPASTGNAGSVTVDTVGLLFNRMDLGSRIATLTGPGTTGNAGSVAVAAPQITITSGAEIASTTAGTWGRRRRHRDNAGGTGARRRGRRQHPDRRLGDRPAISGRAAP